MIPLRLVGDANRDDDVSPPRADQTSAALCLLPNFEECKAILARPEFQIRKALRQQFLQLIENCARFVVPARQLRVTADPGDNIFLECAHAARADYLVTGNVRHSPRLWKRTKIITSREFLSVVAPISSPEYRKEWAERVGLGFNLPTSEPALKLGYRGLQMRKA